MSADVKNIHATKKHEFYNLTDFVSRDDFIRTAESYRSFYNLQKPNWSKKAKTPWLIAEKDHSDTNLATIAQFTEVIDLNSCLSRVSTGGQTLPVLPAFLNFLVFFKDDTDLF